MGCTSVSVLAISFVGSDLDFERKTTLNLDDIGVRQEASLRDVEQVLHSSVGAKK